MLAATRAADSFTESRARWAYRAVVWISVWPSSFPIIGRDSPSANALEAKEWRKSWMNARVSPHERRYDERTHLDGPITDVSLGAGWVASQTVRINASLGWGRERTELERFRKTWRTVQAGVTAVLPWGFTVGGSGMLRWTEFEGDWFTHTDGTPRNDLTRRLSLFAQKRALTLEGFSPQVSVTQEQRSSNAQLHDYERIFGELRFVRLF